MAVVINTNVDSLKIQNILSNATSKMSASMQRMSTGLKINSAKDDAAGSVISARMNVQLNGNKIAQNNVQNGNALLSTAEGNIDVVLDNVSRIRDLTLQAKNGTYSDKEIKAMQDEVAERIAEIDRISASSKYSQLDLFESTELQANGVTFHVGTNATEHDVITANVEIFQSVKFNEITQRKGSEAVTEEYETTDPTLSTGTDPNIVYKYEKVEAGTEGAIKLRAINKTSGKAEGDVIYVKAKEIDQADAVAQNAFVGDTVKYEYKQIKVEGKEAVEAGLDLTALSTVEDFNLAIKNLDDAIDDLTARKSQIGSAQNRLDSALSALTIQNENLSSAKSIITDADIASEASAFTQQQILQQVSTSLLAQANQAPSVALSLV